MSEQAILDLFERWNSALQTKEPSNVVNLYAEDAILLPTISNKVRHNHAEIQDYFVNFLAKGPQGEIQEANVRIFGDIAINSGIYMFSFSDGAQVQARYTFVYRNSDNGWKIIEHHSSGMPE